jgi:hypothetical protein
MFACMHLRWRIRTGTIESMLDPTYEPLPPQILGKMITEDGEVVIVLVPHSLPFDASPPASRTSVDSALASVHACMHADR